MLLEPCSKFPAFCTNLSTSLHVAAEWAKRNGVWKLEQELIEAAGDSARRMNVEVEALAAVAWIESGGRALTTVNGRQEPLIRFEGHYFDRRLKGVERVKAREAGLSSPIAGTVKNPTGQKERWVLLEKAASINRQAAYESTSFGVGQVMGAHWAWLGYPNVDELVKDARAGLGGQIRLMEKYIDKAGLADALRRKDWAKFARGFNGTAYKKNAYDRKLAEAYERLRTRGIARPYVPQSNDTGTQVLRIGMRGEAVANLQQMLTAQGYPTRQDGIFGVQTRSSLIRFQKDAALKQDGIVGVDTRIALEAANVRRNPLPGLWRWLKSQWLQATKSI
jgi:hypothetical protein